MSSKSIHIQFRCVTAVKVFWDSLLLSLPPTPDIKVMKLWSVKHVLLYVHIIKWKWIIIRKSILRAQCKQTHNFALDWLLSLRPWLTCRWEDERGDVFFHSQIFLVPFKQSKPSYWCIREGPERLVEMRFKGTLLRVRGNDLLKYLSFICVANTSFGCTNSLSLPLGVWCFFPSLGFFWWNWIH